MPSAWNKSAGRVFRTQASGPQHAAPTELPLRCLNGDLWKRSDCPLLERLCYFCWRKRASHSPRACVRSEDDCGRQVRVFVPTPSRSEENEAQRLAPGVSGPSEGTSPFAGLPWTAPFDAGANARESRCRRAQEILVGDRE